MIKDRQTAVACIVVLLFGFVLFYLGTDGFRAYTAETARMIQLTKEQPVFPEVTFLDSNGRTYTPAEFKDQYVFITFFYAYCGTVCPQLEINMGKVYERIPEEYVGEDIVFLSISFDPERDGPEQLDQYKDYFDADGETWRMATIPDPEELESLLTQFGVIVIPDGVGNFSHNSAFYVVNPEGVLIDVMDYTKVDEAAEQVLRILEQEAGR